MAKSVNKVIFVGHVGQNPDVRYTKAGNAVTNLSLATTRSSKDPNTNDFIDVTDWHRLVFFNKLAEIAGEYIKQGSRIYVEGFQRTREWIDEARQKRYITEVVVQELVLLSSRNAGSDTAAQGVGDDSSSAPAIPPTSGHDAFDDDIPF